MSRDYVSWLPVTEELSTSQPLILATLCLDFPTLSRLFNIRRHIEAQALTPASQPLAPVMFCLVVVGDSPAQVKKLHRVKKKNIILMYQRARCMLKWRSRGQRAARLIISILRKTIIGKKVVIGRKGKSNTTAKPILASFVLG